MWALLTVYGRQLKYRKLLLPHKRSERVDKWNVGNQFITPPFLIPSFLGAESGGQKGVRNKSSQGVGGSKK